MDVFPRYELILGKFDEIDRYWTPCVAATSKSRLPVSLGTIDYTSRLSNEKQQLSRQQSGELNPFRAFTEGEKSTRSDLLPRLFDKAKATNWVACEGSFESIPSSSAFGLAWLGFILLTVYLIQWVSKETSMERWSSHQHLRIPSPYWTFLPDPISIGNPASFSPRLRSSSRFPTWSWCVIRSTDDNSFI